MLTAIPVGWFLAWLTKDELVSGRKWFRIIFYVLVIVLVVVVLVWKDTPTSMALGYMILVTAMSLFLGKNKKFVKKK